MIVILIYSNYQQRHILYKLAIKIYKANEFGLQLAWNMGMLHLGNRFQN